MSSSQTPPTPPPGWWPPAPAGSQPPPGWQPPPGQFPTPGGFQPPPPPPRSAWYRRGWVIGVLCFAAGLVVGSAVVAGTDNDGGGVDGAAADSPTATVESTEPSEPADGTESAPETPEDTGPDVHNLGDSAPVGDYKVAVKSVDQDANDIIDAANTFNEPPKGQYVLVKIRVKYTGRKEGDPWLDLTAKYVGTDNRQYDTSQCEAVVPKEASDVPTLQKGGSATYQECFDVRPSAIKGGQVFVEDWLSFSDESRVYWSGE